MRSAAAVLTLGTLAVLAVPRSVSAIPAFARRYEQSCTTCHQFHYPRLNALGRRFQENGYQLPDGAEDPARARRTVEPGTIAEDLAVFKEVPLSVRGQVLGVIPIDAEAQDQPVWDTRVFSYLAGGGSVARDVSFFMSFTPFPDAVLHQARIGLHNLLEDWIGEGTLHFRAGALLLLDFSRPAHRFLAPAPDRIGAVSVGQNLFRLDDPAFGAQINGRPGWGPLHYELAVVAGDPGPEGTERDDWKDAFARASYTLFHDTDHELLLGALGYLGRSDIQTDLGGVVLAQRDDFWLAGGEVEWDIGPVNLFGMGYVRRHSDPLPDGRTVWLRAYRTEAHWLVHRRITASLRYEQVISDDLPSLRERALTPHLSYLIATNVVAAGVARLDLRDMDRGSVVLVLDAAF